jgi:hypothetical protein
VSWELRDGSFNETLVVPQGTTARAGVPLLGELN